MRVLSCKLNTKGNNIRLQINSAETYGVLISGFLSATSSPELHIYNRIFGEFRMVKIKKFAKVDLE